MCFESLLQLCLLSRTELRANIAREDTFHIGQCLCVNINRHMVKTNQEFTDQRDGLARQKLVTQTKPLG